MTGPSPAPSPALAALLEDYRRADEALDRWHAEVWNPARTAHIAALAALDARPFTVTTPEYRNVVGGMAPARTYSTARKMDVAECRGVVSIPLDKQSDDPAWRRKYAAACELVAEADRIEAERQRLDEQHGVAALEAEEAERWKPVNAARDAIRAFQPASAAELIAKLEHLFPSTEPGDDPHGMMPIVLADLERLSEGQAA